MNRFPEHQPAVIVRGVSYVGVAQQEEVCPKEGGGDSVVYRSKDFFVVHSDDGTLGCYQNSTLQDIFDVSVE